MKKVTYVFKGKNFTTETTSYDRALNIKAQTGVDFIKEYREIKEENTNRGKYAGLKPKTPYVPAYR